MSNNTFKLRPETLPQSRGDLLALIDKGYGIDTMESLCADLFEALERMESLYTEEIEAKKAMNDSALRSVCSVGATVGAEGWTVVRPAETPAEAVGRTGLLTLREACGLVAIELGAEPTTAEPTTNTEEQDRAALELNVETIKGKSVIMATYEDRKLIECLWVWFSGSVRIAQGLRAALDESRLQVDKLREENAQLRYEIDRIQNDLDEIHYPVKP